MGAVTIRLECGCQWSIAATPLMIKSHEEFHLRKIRAARAATVAIAEERRRKRYATMCDRGME